MKFSIVLSALASAAMAAPYYGHGWGYPGFVDTAPEYESFNYVNIDNEKGPFGKLYPEKTTHQSTKTGFDHSIVHPWGYGYGYPHHGFGWGKWDNDWYDWD